MALYEEATYVRIVHGMNEDNIITARCAVGMQDGFTLESKTSSITDYNPCLISVTMDKITNEINGGV